jgi:hypothetical protein
MIVAARSQDHHPELSTTRSRQERRRVAECIARQHHRRDQSTATRLGGYAQALTCRRRVLENIATIYREQPAVYPLQVEATVTHLAEMRRVAGAAHRYLNGLEPAETQRVKPYGASAKLFSVDTLLTEMLLQVAMFADVCQSIRQERIELHIMIRSAFQVLIATYDDCIAQLAALADKAQTSQPTNQGGHVEGEAQV